MTMDQTRANEILTWMHGGSAPTALTGPIRLRLLTAMGTTTADGTQVATGGGYTATAAGGSTGGISTTWAAASAASQATNAVAQVTNYPRAETVVGIEVVDSTAGTIKRVEFGTLGTSRAMAAGDTLSFASGAITSALS